MTLVATPTGRERPSALAPALAAAAAALALAVIALGVPSVAARGWLVGWFLALSVAVGSAVLVLIHALTGGRWRAAGEPWLSAAASSTPTLCLAGAVLLLTQGVLYPWAQPSWEPSGGGSVEARWLNAPLFTARSAAALAVLAGLGLLAGRGRSVGARLTDATDTRSGMHRNVGVGRSGDAGASVDTGRAAMTGPGVGAAALGLVLYAVTISVVGLDWLLSLDPGFDSTDFGAQMAITQIACGLAFAALMGLSPDDAQARADWGGLTLTALLGCLYLAAMQFLVSWSGDLPGKAAWYLARNQGAGLAMAWTILVVGGVIPFAMLLLTAARRSRAVLRVVGGLVLAGAWAHLVWIITPISSAYGWVIASAFLTTLLFAALGEAWRLRRGR